MHRIGAQHGDGINLLGHLHGAELGGVGGGHLARQQGGGQQGGDLAGQTEGQQATYGHAGPPAGELCRHLDVEDGAGGQARDHDDQQAGGTGLKQFLQQVLDADAAPGDGTDRLAADHQAGAETLQPARRVHQVAGRALEGWRGHRRITSNASTTNTAGIRPMQRRMAVRALAGWRIPLEAA